MAVPFCRIPQCKLQYGSSCPPESNLRNWGKKLAVQGFIAPIGRPGRLSGEEDKVLAEHLSAVCAEGGVVDRDWVFILMFNAMRYL